MSFPRAFFFSSVLCLSLAFSASASAGESDFFSSERFELDPYAVGRLTGRDRAKKELENFVAYFTKALEDFSAGDMAGARAALLKARGIWPEYFGTDFMLALVYENLGEYATAARFYKSYLNKLRDYYSGNYPISANLIQAFSSERVESYDEARWLVRERLERSGIDLDRVRPVVTFPPYLVGLFTATAALGAYLVFQYIAWPYIKRQRRINNPPEDFWICRHCLTANPDLSKVCQKCRRPREVQSADHSPRSTG